MRPLLSLARTLFPFERHILNRCITNSAPESLSLQKGLPELSHTVDVIDTGEAADAVTSAPSPVVPVEFVKFTVNPEEEYTRLDRFVKRRAPGLPPGLIQKLVRKGRILVDGTPPKNNAFKVLANSVVEVPGSIKLGLTRGKRAPPPDDTTLAESSEIRQWIIYRNARCVVLNKPPGIPTQHNGDDSERTIEAMLSGIGSGRYWLVHRLDKEVSGALVVARDIGAAGLLADHFRSREVEKIYWALVHGNPVTKQGVITAPIDGKYSHTKYSVIESNIQEKYSWLKLEPKTGRKHQLRIHCASVLGTPIVGEKRYAPVSGFKQLLENQSIQGLNLHARCIRFPQLTQVHLGGAKPQLGRNPKSHVFVEAPLPAHMQSFWQSIGILNDETKDDTVKSEATDA